MCVFCKIINGELPSTKVYEDEQVLAFRDIQPQAPTHILIVPKEHVGCIAETRDEPLLGHLFATAARIAQEQGLENFRLIVNNGADAGQTVAHLHVHLLAGKSMTERLV